ncbi:unnamed protein product [Debaryomyces tyrocola]|nr:unnamed protein product [Debaryomyces tyrocola]
MIALKAVLEPRKIQPITPIKRLDTKCAFIGSLDFLLITTQYFEPGKPLSRENDQQIRACHVLATTLQRIPVVMHRH